MPGDFQHVLIEHDGGVTTIIMNRPHVLNAFNNRLLQEVTEAAETAAHDETVRCVVLMGAGRAFGAGQDLSEFTASYARGEMPTQEHLQKYHTLVKILREMPKPVIAAIRGIATGISLNIALACDLRIAADDARLSEGFAKIGLVPDGGGAYFLPRLIGLGKALEMALLAEDVSAQEAERLGLINRCVPASELDAATSNLAHRLANGPTTAYGLMKKLFYASLDSDLQTVLDLEGNIQAQAIATADHREGVTAFLQKRPPLYTGK